MKNKLRVLALLGILLLLGYSCRKLEPKAPPPEDALDAPVSQLSAAQNQLFNAGAEEFDENYTTQTGLGPIYVSTSCASCHTADNRGHLFTILTRFGQSDTNGNPYHHLGAPQVQNHAVQGHLAEVLPAGLPSSKFIAPITSGVGFLEAVPDQDILAMAEANKNNADGVRGHPNWNTIPGFVTPMPSALVQNGKYICRFGRKASTYNLHQQTVQALNQDMGITTTFMPQNPMNYLEGLQTFPISEPELSDAKLNSMVFYMQALQTPIARNSQDAAVQRGKQIFVQAGCETCHKQTLRTGQSAIAALAYQEFHPYTDLLLHDMGPKLDDGYTEGSAKTTEWRTTPLWGLGLARDAQGGNLFLLHDGRARTIEEAIEYHGGEAQQSLHRYHLLSESDRQSLMTFLKSL